MLTERDAEFLRELSLFAGLRDDVMRTITDHASRIELEAGQVLFEEGTPAKEMLVVVQGEIEVIKTADSGLRSCIATLGPGDVAGEMSLFDIQPRSAELRAGVPSAVVSISHSALAAVYREDKSSYTLLVLNIAREISIRLRRLDATLANIMSEIRAATNPAPAGRRANTEPGSGLFSIEDSGTFRSRRDTIPGAGPPAAVHDEVDPGGLGDAPPPAPEGAGE